VWQYLQGLLTRSGGPIREVKVFDLKQSMQNGGGPACLRLRVALNETELAAVNPGVIMTPALYDTLTANGSANIIATACAKATWPTRNCYLNVARHWMN
jgi:succinylarginine dihydrolase